MPIPDTATPVVVAYAHYAADADALAKEFLTQCQQAFGSKGVNLWQDPVTAGHWLRLRREGLTYPQVFDKYRGEHADWFP